MTPYAYTNHNPIMLVDPDVRNGEDPPISFGGSIGIGGNGINFNAEYLLVFNIEHLISKP